MLAIQVLRVREQLAARGCGDHGGGITHVGVSSSKHSDGHPNALVTSSPSVRGDDIDLHDTQAAHAGAAAMAAWFTARARPVVVPSARALCGDASNDEDDELVRALVVSARASENGRRAVESGSSGGNGPRREGDGGLRANVDTATIEIDMD